MAVRGEQAGLFVGDAVGASTTMDPYLNA